MKATGMVRKVDELGRIVIPAETREIFGIGHGTALEIFVSSDQIILQVYTPGCHFCGEADGLTQHRGKNICRMCLEHLRVRVRGDLSESDQATLAADISAR